MVERIDDWLRQLLVKGVLAIKLRSYVFRMYLDREMNSVMVSYGDEVAWCRDMLSVAVDIDGASVDLDLERGDLVINDRVAVINDLDRVAKYLEENAGISKKLVDAFNEAVSRLSKVLPRIKWMGRYLSSMRSAVDEMDRLYRELEAVPRAMARDSEVEIELGPDIVRVSLPRRLASIIECANGSVTIVRGGVMLAMSRRSDCFNMVEARVSPAPWSFRKGSRVAFIVSDDRYSYIDEDADYVGEKIIGCAPGIEKDEEVERMLSEVINGETVSDLKTVASAVSKYLVLYRYLP